MNRYTACSLLLLSMFISFSASYAEEPKSTPDAKAPFTIIALPDTQNYSSNFPDIFMKQTEWIRDNKDKLNIAAVFHLGDVTNGNSEKEWENANKALSILDDKVPLFLIPGNHDTGPGGGRGNFETEMLDKYFPPSRVEKKPWFGGVYEKHSIKNAYYFFEAGGMKFIVICLEFGPRDAVLDWANKIVSEHKDRKVIVITHNYMYSDDTRVGPGDSWNPHDYPNGGNDGEDMWKKFVGKHENMFMVLSGHILNDGRGRQTSEGEKGIKVHEILANYQMQPRGGEGWLRIMKFDPSTGKINVSTYSPDLDKYEEHEENKFELEFNVK